MQSKWIYALENQVDDANGVLVLEGLSAALAPWVSHGVPVRHHVQFMENQFIFIAALTDASGCGIDWLRNTVSGVLATKGLRLADAGMLHFESPSGRVSLNFKDVPVAYDAGKLSPEATYYDTTVVNQDTFEGFKKPLKSSWVGQRLVRV